MHNTRAIYAHSLLLQTLFIIILLGIIVHKTLINKIVSYNSSLDAYRIGQMRKTLLEIHTNSICNTYIFLLKIERIIVSKKIISRCVKDREEYNNFCFNEFNIYI